MFTGETLLFAYRKVLFMLRGTLGELEEASRVHIQAEKLG